MSYVGHDSDFRNSHLCVVDLDMLYRRRPLPSGSRRSCPARRELTHCFLLQYDSFICRTPASMEPRYVNRGNQALGLGNHARSLSASMEPRYVNRGNNRLSRPHVFG